MDINYTEILIAIIGLIGLILTKVLVPFIKLKKEEVQNKLSKEQQEKIEFWTEVAVVAIEKRYEGQEKKGLSKKFDVIDFVKRLNLPIDDVQLSMLVDCLVEKLINEPYYEYIQE